MMYEFKVSEMADEFGVHRNTIRNWINAGTLPAKKGPGRKYLMTFEDYQSLCEKFGREPLVNPTSNVDPDRVQKYKQSTKQLKLLDIGYREKTIYSDAQWADACQTCGTCAGACPISGVDGLDPRKIVRMAVLGMEDELKKSDWPWKCTMCGMCENVCPAGVEILELIRRLRSLRKRDLVPGSIQEGVTTCLERGNNLGIPKDDFVLLCEVLGRELVEEGLKGFKTPIDVVGSRVLVTVNSKEPFSEPDDMKFLWRILYTAEESWTISSENWEGVNWGYFSGDDNAMKTVVGRIVDNMRRLQCEVLLLPEIGHAYYATRTGLNRWFPDALKEFKILSMFDLLIEYLNQDRIKLDNTRHLMRTTYHDPCNYGRRSMKAFGKAYYEEGRIITRAACRDFIDMEPNGEMNYCCGAGGGAWAMPFTQERVFYGRMKARQIEETGAKLVIAPCHNCRDQLRRSLNHEYDLGIEVKCLWELVADSLVMPEQEKEAARAAEEK